MWKSRRQRYVALMGKRCEVCETTAEPIFLHHLYYDRLGAEANGDLALLCERCHVLAHRWPNFGPTAVQLMRESWRKCGDPSPPIVKRERRMKVRAQTMKRSTKTIRPDAPVRVFYLQDLSEDERKKYGDEHQRSGPHGEPNLRSRATVAGER